MQGEPFYICLQLDAVCAEHEASAAKVYTYAQSVSIIRFWSFWTEPLDNLNFTPRFRRFGHPAPERNLMRENLMMEIGCTANFFDNNFVDKISGSRFEQEIVHT